MTLRNIMRYLCGGNEEYFTHILSNTSVHKTEQRAFREKHFRTGYFLVKQPIYSRLFFQTTAFKIILNFI